MIDLARANDRIMNATSPWKAQLRTPHPCDHVVQLYTEPDFLASAVAHFVGSGFAAGEAAIIIATPDHAGLFMRALTTQGFEVARLSDKRQLVVLDAETCLAEFMVEGAPDRVLFRSLIDGVLDSVRAAGFPNIRLFGEMVNLLWSHNLDSTIQLEELWNEALADHRLSLLCAYQIDPFDHHAYRGVLHRISRSHSYLIPLDDYARLDQAVGLAFTDVFGIQGDADRLRELFVRRQLPSSAAMPSAQAALFAVRDLPDSVGDAILDSARRHYGA
jgi:MEDS: MEthanogen/methylotroph, DcmR Sensory domain